LDAADSSSVTLSGSYVTAWTDKSGAGNDSTGVLGDVTYSTNSQNGKNTLLFSTGMISGAFGSVYTGSEMTYMFVGSLSSTNSEFATIMSIGLLNTPDYSNQECMNVLGRAQNSSDLVSYRNLPPYTATTISPGGYDVYVMVAVVVNGTTQTVYLNGTQVDQVTYSYTPNFNLEAWTIGNSARDDSLNTQYTAFSGRYAESVMYEAALNTSDRQSMEGYLAWKWGLQGNLPDGHPYKNTAPIGPQPATFSPSSLTGLVTWLDGADASTITLGGGTVTTWADKSGNGHDATHASGSGPTYSSNGLNFTGQNMPTGTPFSSQITVVLVATQQSGGSTYYIRRSGAPADSPSFIVNYDGSKLEYFNGADRNTFATSPASLFYTAFTYDQGNQVKGWYNGTNVFTIDQTQSGNSPGSFPIILGAPGFDLSARIHEFVVYNRVLTDGEMGQVNSYLSAKWSV
jgi:hypothetical protein